MSPQWPLWKQGSMLTCSMQFPISGLCDSFLRGIKISWNICVLPKWKMGHVTALRDLLFHKQGFCILNSWEEPIERAQIVMQLSGKHEEWVNTYKTQSSSHLTPALGKQRQEDGWSSRARQCSRASELQVQWVPLSQKVRWKAIENDTWSRPLVSTCTCMCNKHPYNYWQIPHTHAHTCTSYRNTLTHTIKKHTA